MTDFAANLAFFLLDRAGSVCGKWSGRMRAKEQRTLFGQFLGKGWLTINGGDETVRHSVQTCFGLDSTTTARGTWGDLCRGVDLRNVYVRDGVPCRG